MAHPRPAAHRARTGHIPIRQASLREHNLALVLRAIAVDRHAPAAPSRANLATRTGLSRATVSTLVDELIGAELLTETAPATRGAVGRPSVGLRLNPQGVAALGLEINVDYLAVCVVDLTGAVRHHRVRYADLRSRTPGKVLVQLETLAGRAAADAAEQGLRLAGACLAVPGLVEGALVRRAPNLDWVDVPIPAIIAGLPVTVDNESNLGALGELAANPKLPRSFAYISGEIGIGAGIVVDGELMRGGRGFAGEIGHLTIQPDGPVCRCGARGCLEQYAGQDAIRLAAGRPAPPEGIPAGVADFAALAAAGNLPMRTALDRAGEAIGVAVAGLVNLLDLGTVVLGGSFAQLEPWLRNGITHEIDRRVLTARWSPVELVASVLGGDAAVRGAAGAVLRGVVDHPAAWVSSR